MPVLYFLISNISLDSEVISNECGRGVLSSCSKMCQPKISEFCSFHIKFFKTFLLHLCVYMVVCT